MSDIKSQKVGEIGEKGLLKGLAVKFDSIGAKVSTLDQNIQDYKILREFIRTSDYSSEYKVAWEIASGLADSLSGKLFADIIKYLADNSITTDNLEYEFIKTSANTDDNKKTDDFRIVLKKQNKVVFDIKFSQKTKTESDGRMDGNSSTNNVIFMIKVLEGTGLIEKYPQILEIVSEKMYLEKLSEFIKILKPIKAKHTYFNPKKKKITNIIPPEYISSELATNEVYKKRVNSSGPLASVKDAASIMVDKHFGFEGSKYGNKSNDLDWKTSSMQKIKKAFEFIQTLDEYPKQVAKIGKNIKGIAGLKDDVEMAVSAVRGSSFFAYSSLQDKKYRKLVDSKVKSIYIGNTDRGGIYFVLDGIKYPLQRIPAGICFTFNLLKELGY